MSPASKIHHYNWQEDMGKTLVQGAGIGEWGEIILTKCLSERCGGIDTYHFQVT